MSSKSKTQLSLQDKREIIETIEAREKVGANQILRKLREILTLTEQQLEK